MRSGKARQSRLFCPPVPHCQLKIWPYIIYLFIYYFPASFFATFPSLLVLHLYRPSLCFAKSPNSLPAWSPLIASACHNFPPQGLCTNCSHRLESFLSSYLVHLLLQKLNLERGRHWFVISFIMHWFVCVSLLGIGPETLAWWSIEQPRATALLFFQSSSEETLRPCGSNPLISQMKKLRPKVTPWFPETNQCNWCHFLCMCYVCRGPHPPWNGSSSRLDLITFLDTIMGITALSEPVLNTEVSLPWWGERKVGTTAFPGPCASSLQSFMTEISISDVLLNVWGQREILSRSTGFEDVPTNSHWTLVCTRNPTERYMCV